MDAISTTSLLPGNGAPATGPASLRPAALGRYRYASVHQDAFHQDFRFGRGVKGFGVKSLGLNNRENKRVIWGYLLRWGSPVVALAVSFLSGPFACCVAPLSFWALWFAEKKGTQLIKESKRHKLSGIPKHTEHIRHLWEETRPNDLRTKGNQPYKELREHYNAIVDIMFKKRKSIRRRLLLRPKKSLDRLVQDMFHVQVMYRRHWLGKNIRRIRKWSSKGIFRFPLFRYPMLGFSWALQFFLTLFASGKARRMIRQAAR